MQLRLILVSLLLRSDILGRMIDLIVTVILTLIKVGARLIVLLVVVVVGEVYIIILIIKHLRLLLWLVIKNGLLLDLLTIQF